MLPDKSQWFGDFDSLGNFLDSKQTSPLDPNPITQALTQQNILQTIIIQSKAI